MFAWLSRYKYLLLFVLLIIVIIAVASSIFYINSSLRPKHAENSPGYNSLEQSVTSLGDEKTLAGLAGYAMLKKDIFSLNNPKLTDSDKYNLLLLDELRISMMYEDTNSHMLYLFNDELKKFAEKNFPKLYKESKFTLTCSDPECATTQAKEISGIADIINSSSLPNDLKKPDAQMFITLSYINKGEAEQKVKRLYFTAQNIKDDENYKNAGINFQIYTDIIDFLIKNYPEELKKASSTQDLEKLRGK